MGKKNRLILIFGAMVLLFPRLIFSQDGHSARFIMDEVIRRAKENDRQKIEHLTFRKNHMVRDLKTREITARASYSVYGKNGKMFEELISASANYKDKKREIPDLNEALTNRYDFELGNPAIISENGRYYYKIQFSPTKNLGNIPNEKIADRVVNRLKGVLLIDIVDYYVYKADAELNGTVWAYGPGFAMSKMDLHMEQKKFGDFVVVKKITAIGGARVGLFFKFLEEHEFIYENYIYYPQQPH